MIHSNKKETQAEGDKNANEQTIEEQLKEAREEVLSIFKAKNRTEEPPATSDSQNSHDSDN
jgi:hypothetical protein